MEGDEFQQLLRAASEEHERTRELLVAHGGPGSADAASREAAGPEQALATSSLLEARLVWIFGSPAPGARG